jgi:hypothetical protein
MTQAPLSVECNWIITGTEMCNYLAQWVQAALELALGKLWCKPETPLKRQLQVRWYLFRQ